MSTMPMLAFDTETTGVNVYEDRIIQIALVDMIPGQRPDPLVIYVDPGIEIPAESQAIHGFTREMLLERGAVAPAVALATVAEQIASRWRQGWPVVGFNLAYDFTITQAELARHGLGVLGKIDKRGKWMTGDVLDAFVLDKMIEPRRKGKRKLVDVCQRWDVVHAGAHDAAADAIASARLIPKLLEKYIGNAFDPEKHIPAALHQEQIKARRAQQNSLRSYFDRERIAHDGVDGGWPFYDGLVDHLKTIPNGAAA